MNRQQLKIISKLFRIIPSTNLADKQRKIIRSEMTKVEDKYQVIVLFEGYCKTTQSGSTSNCTCTLIRGPKNMVVDTMTAWDGPNLKTAIERYGLRCSDIDYVICTHGHSDHIGCNYLFQNATHIVGFDISQRDTYYDFDFTKGEPYIICDAVRVIPTPGHTKQDVSVIVSTDEGIYAITGDLFENLDDERNWETVSEDKNLQTKYRNEILKYATFIIPGHGPMFKASNKWDKRKCRNIYSEI